MSQVEPSFIDLGLETRAGRQDAMTLHIEEHGRGAPVLLLLHGMSCTGAVWRPVVDALARRPGRIVVVDLPGHGGSDPLDEYTYESVSSAVAAVIPAGEALIVVGHSFGGAIATYLASGRWNVSPVAVLAVGVKVVWSSEELAGAASIAQKPARWFDSREEAEERYRKVAGLGVEAPHELLERGVVAGDGGFRLSADQRTPAIGDPQMSAAVAAAQCRVLLGRGEHDPMVSPADLVGLGAETFEIPGAGHNAHVDQPALLAALIADLAAVV